MEIAYLGVSSFKIKYKNGMVLITDPYDPDGADMPFAKEKADIVTISTDNKKHNYSLGITGPVKREEVFVINEEGEYEVGGVEVVTIKEGEENLVMVIRQNGISVCHLGALSGELSEKQIEKLGSIDVLLLPVGNENKFGAKEMEGLISNISPSIVVPMNYKNKDELSEFLDSSSLEVMLDGVDKLKIDSSMLPENSKVVVFGQINGKS